MSQKREFTRSEKWSVYRSLVVLALVEAGYNKEHFELADSLDMSFEEIESLPTEQWLDAIKKDLHEMIADCPEDFEHARDFR